MADYLKMFSNSLARMEDVARDGEIIDCLYDQFLASAPEAAEKFEKTEMERQKEMLRDSFKLMLDFSTRRRSDDELERIALRHGSADLDIPSRLYTAWLDSLVAAVAKIDPEFDAGVATAWRIVMAPGIEFMKGHYESA